MVFIRCHLEFWLSYSLLIEMAMIFSRLKTWPGFKLDISRILEYILGVLPLH